MSNYANKRSGNNKLSKTFKDYLIPIVIVFVILLVIINKLFSTGGNSSSSIQNNSPVEVSFGVPETEAYVIYSGGNKTKLEQNGSIYKTEKLQVANGNLNIKDKSNEFSLNKLGELKYNEDGSYTLYSSDLWVKTQSGVDIEMRYAKVLSKDNSIFSLSQNEVASTIYVVSGIVQVQNLAGKSTSLQKGEKLVIMRNNANDDKSDLALSKEQIDDYTKSDDWFIKNNGLVYLTANDGNQTSSGNTNTGSTNSGTTSQDFGGYISFNNLYDEIELSSNSVDIEGNILSDDVNKIDINGETATIDNTTKTFNLKGFKLNSKTNDLIYRVYDSFNKILYKGVLTVYTNNISSTSSNNSDSNLAQVQNYPISSSPLYQILTPKQNPYTSSEDVIRIEGTVPAGTVAKIIINDFELQKFPKFGSYWSYFANSGFGNLKPGVNIYKIQYFGADGKIIYENNFTIIKEEKVIETSTGTIENTTTVETSTGTAQ
ncbi:MAG: hypothetical protein PHE25_02815 [Candidatus Gracilibacteria bacterium]|nr:hypothetical protein [Candidatus Gracilibacteria bacterium]